VLPYIKVKIPIYRSVSRNRGPVSNGTLHLYLQSRGLTMAAIFAWSWSPPDHIGCPICHFRFQKGARGRPLCGRYLVCKPMSSVTDYFPKVQTHWKTARVYGAILDRA